MKKNLFLLIISLPVISFLFTSCDKDDDMPKTKTELLTQASWKYKSATVGGTAYNSFPACQTDNILSFNTSGTGVVDEGTTKCNGGDPQMNTFNWSFQNAEAEILLSSPLFTNGSTTVTLVSVTETQLVLLIPVSTPGPIIMVEVTFEH